MCQLQSSLSGHWQDSILLGCGTENLSCLLGGGWLWAFWVASIVSDSLWAYEPFFRWSSWPKNQIWVSYIAGRHSVPFHMGLSRVAASFIRQEVEREWVKSEKERETGSKKEFSPLCLTSEMTLITLAVFCYWKQIIRSSPHSRGGAPMEHGEQEVETAGSWFGRSLPF